MSQDRQLQVIYKYYPHDTDPEKIQSMRVYYCRYCGEFVLILPYDISSFPIRKRDSSRVIEESTTDFKYNLYYGGDIYVRRESLFEKQCRLYCNHCKLLIAYRQSPPKESSKFMYIVKGSITNDPDIMLREVKNYKLQIPPCIQRDPDDPSNSTIIILSICYGKEINSIGGVTDQNLIINLKHVYDDEGKSNSYLLQFFSSFFHISSLDLSLLHVGNSLAIRIENIDYEDMYLKLKEYC